VRHVKVGMQIGEGVSTMNADGRKVKQIVYNLLSNAVKFTAPDGQVTLAAHRVDASDVGKLDGIWPSRMLPFDATTFPEFLRLSVTDNGIGVAPEGLSQLFKPFSQVDSGLARHFEGTGLGLAMVKLLADLHGGAVAVESAVGQGSRFTVWIPIRAKDSVDPVPPQTTQPAPVASPKPTSAKASAPRPATRNALVVESNYRSAELIRVQLEAGGFSVLLATTAAEAIAIAEREKLSLITLDIMMPDVDGWAFLGRLKEIPALQAVPVIIISILADRTRGFSLGAAAVMQSPVSRQELNDTLLSLGLSSLSGEHMIRVLVVDDDPKAVELVAVRIRRMASEVFRAYGGREAIEVARRELPDLIVLDLIMPDVDGFEVVRALSDDPATAGIPVIVVTASEITPNDRVRLDGDVASVIRKANFDGKQFVAEVRRAMGRTFLEL
jgi:CheY-like chemotaxis protein